jgi:hypothetical protein
VDELVARLGAAGQQVAVGGPSPSVGELHHRLTDLGFVFLRFPATIGGTDLGVRVDGAATDLGAADFGSGTGAVHVEGTLTLNFERVRAVVDIDLTTLEGTGRLEAIDEAPPP